MLITYCICVSEHEFNKTRSIIITNCFLTNAQIINNIVIRTKKKAESGCCSTKNWLTLSIDLFFCVCCNEEPLEYLLDSITVRVTQQPIKKMLKLNFIRSLLIRKSVPFHSFAFMFSPLLFLICGAQLTRGRCHCTPIT